MAELERLTSSDDLDPILDGTVDGPVWIFKHSLTCSISDAAWSEYQRFVEAQEGGDTRYVVVEIQRARDLSREIARRTGIRHESPQALLIENGEVAWHASHWSITTSSLAAAGGA